MSSGWRRQPEDGGPPHRASPDGERGVAPARARTVPPQREHVCPRRPYTRGLMVRGPSAADCCIRGRTASITRQRLGVADAGQRAPGVDRRLPASLGLPDVARARPHCADQAVRRRACGSGHPSAAGPGRSRRRTARQHIGAESGQPLVQTQPGIGHQLQDRAPELDHPPVPTRRTIQARRHGCRAAVTNHRPTMPRWECRVRAAFEPDEQVFAVRVDTVNRPAGQRSGQRSTA